MPLQKPPYSSKSVSNFFLAKSRAITQMKLHKLLYFAHGWHLGLTNLPLLDEMVEAWQDGPIVPSVFHEFKTFGLRPITQVAQEFNPQKFARETVPPVDAEDTFVHDLLERIWEVYNGFSDDQLFHLIYTVGSPWSKTHNQHPGIKGVDIPNQLFAEHFAVRVRENAR